MLNKIACPQEHHIQIEYIIIYEEEDKQTECIILRAFIHFKATP